MRSCLGQCLHVTIDHELKDKSREAERVLKEKYKGKSFFVNLRPDLFYIGALGQYGVYKYLEGRGVEHTSYEMIPLPFGDYVDLILPYHTGDRMVNLKIDIKASTLGNGRTTVSPRNGCILKVPKGYGEPNFQHRPKVHGYLFTKVTEETDTLHIVGLMNYYTFWEQASEGNPNQKYPSRYTRCEKTKCLECFLFHINCGRH